MPKILVIDDTDRVRINICNILKKSGNEVLEAKDGEQALEVLKNNKCDLLILDVVMPKKGGIQALMEINKIDPKVKVIIITGRVPQESDAFRLLSKSFGVKDIIYKPFKKNDLLEKVNNCINN